MLPPCTYAGEFGTRLKSFVCGRGQTPAALRPWFFLDWIFIVKTTPRITIPAGSKWKTLIRKACRDSPSERIVFVSAPGVDVVLTDCVAKDRTPVWDLSLDAQGDFPGRIELVRADAKRKTFTLSEGARTWEELISILDEFTAGWDEVLERELQELHEATKRFKESEKVFQEKVREVNELGVSYYKISQVTGYTAVTIGRWLK